MRTSIVAIGNSQGIRLPKLLLKQSGLTSEVELQVKRGEIRITPVKNSSPVTLLSLASEDAFAKDWSRPEEDKAWKPYQSDK